MKKALAILLTLLLLLSAAGCAKEEKRPRRTENREETEEEFENFFIDTWYKDGDMTDMCMKILPDGSWTLYDALLSEEDAPSMLAAGTAEVTGEGVLTIYYDAEDAATAWLNDDDTVTVEPGPDGNWCLDYGFLMYREADSWIPETEAPDFSDYVGLWKYDGWDEWLEIYSDGSWERLGLDGELMESGMLTAYEDHIVIGGGNADTEFFCVDSETLTDSIGSTLARAEEVASTPFFDANELYPNIEADKDLHIVDPGAYYFSDDLSSYLTGRVFWQLEVLDDFYTEDGLREVILQANCYFVDGIAHLLPSGSYTFGAESNLYDRYSGAVLPAETTTGDAERDYSCTIEANGRSYDIHYNTDVTWDSDDPEWDNVLYKTIHVIFPAEYDGLMFCMQEAFDTYDEYAEFSTLKQLEAMGDKEIEHLRNGLIYSFG